MISPYIYIFIGTASTPFITTVGVHLLDTQTPPEVSLGFQSYRTSGNGCPDAAFFVWHDYTDP